MKRWQIGILTWLLAAGTLVPAVSSCSMYEAAEARGKLEKLRVGMTRDEVRGVMGEPLKNEVFTDAPNVWFYYTAPKWYDGMITRDECTPLVFDEREHLAGWGWEFGKKALNRGEWERRSLDPQL